MSNEKIDILLQNQLLEVDLNDLKGNDDALIGIVAQDPTNHKLFLQFAFEYYKRGMPKEFEKFLLAGKNQAQNSMQRMDDPERNLLLLNTLAAYYIEAAKKLGDKEMFPACNPSGGDRTAQQLIKQAAELLNDAERISRSNKFTFLGKANILLLNMKPNSPNEMRELDQVFNNYKSCLVLDPNFVPALIGMADVYFRRKNYRMSLEFYQKILLIEPNLVPDVRVPIGICFLKLEMESEAELAFLRALELDSKNSIAILMLSLMDTNRAKDESLTIPERKAYVKSANSRLAKAFQIDPKNSLCNTQMALKMIERDAKKAKTMSTAALLYTKNSILRANAHLINGRIAHSEGLYKEAFENYKAAADDDPNSTVIQFYLGLLYIEKGNHENAIKCLENVITKNPQDYDSLKILFSLYSQTSNEKVLQPLEMIAKMSMKPKALAEIKSSNILEEIIVKDAELLSDIALHLEKTNVLGARKKYMELLTLLKKQDKPVPPELLNNMAVLYHLEAVGIQDYFDGNPTNLFKILPEEATENNLNQAFAFAESLYQQALTQLADDSFLATEDKFRVHALQTSIRYNVARLFECRGDVDKAEMHYKDLLKLHPAFIECMIESSTTNEIVGLLRIGCIEQLRGNNEEALNYYSDALAIEPENAMAWSMVGNLHLASKSYRAARKSFEKILETERHDVYALCSVGNLCLIFARGDVPNRGLHFSRAIEFFCKSLSLQPGNLHAATGIGIAYAETGKFAEAREVFLQILELSAGESWIACNAGHTLIELGQIIPAIALYESVLKKIGIANDPVSLKALARAHYILGKTTKEPNSMRNARKLIQKAIHAFPGDKSLYFNLALIEQQFAQVLNEQSSENRSVDALKSALRDIDISANLFKFLTNVKPSPSLKYDVARAKERAAFCSTVRKVTEKKIHECEVLQRQREERLHEIREMKKEAELEKMRKQQEEEELARKKEAEVDARRKEIQAQNQEMNEKMRVEKSRKHAQDSSDESEDEQRRLKKKKSEGGPIVGRQSGLSKAIISDTDSE